MPLINEKYKQILRDSALSILILAATVLISNELSKLFDDNNQFSAALFILAVSLIARFTRGYIYGIAASIIGVVCVNYMFTFPYWEFNLSLTGYPLTFSVMLIVSLIISTLTSRVKRQEQLRMEVELEKMRSNLLRTVSHDIRTPLTAIIGSSSVMLENENISEAERRELLSEINKDASWLVRITENLLSVTKFSGQVKLNTEYEAVEEITASAIVKFKTGHERFRISVKKPDEILTAPMDATLIEQVILNIFDNVAIHGIGATEIKVRISAGDRRVTIAVEDNGCGIPPRVLPHLFDGQASISGGHSDDQRSMGIGLSVCRSIIVAHGGDIRGYNGKNGGAVFEFWLPDRKG